MSENDIGEETTQTPDDQTVDANPIETLGSIYVCLVRIYDALMLQGLNGDNQEQFEQLLIAHEAGRVISPPPVLIEYGGNEE